MFVLYAKNCQAIIAKPFGLSILFIFVFLHLNWMGLVPINVELFLRLILLRALVVSFTGERGLTVLLRLSGCLSLILRTENVYFWGEIALNFSTFIPFLKERILIVPLFIALVFGETICLADLNCLKRFNVLFLSLSITPI